MTACTERNERSPKLHFCFFVFEIPSHDLLYMLRKTECVCVCVFFLIRVIRFSKLFKNKGINNVQQKPILDNY